MSQLTNKQRRFVEEYAVDHNATQAAIRAGYSEDSAGQQGHRLLKNDEIAKMVGHAEEKAVRAAQLTREFVLEGLMDIAANGKVESARTRAFELLGKHMAMWTDRLEVTQITKDALHAEIERLERELADA